MSFVTPLKNGWGKRIGIWLLMLLPSIPALYAIEATDGRAFVRVNSRPHESRVVGLGFRGDSCVRLSFIRPQVVYSIRTQKRNRNAICALLTLRAIAVHSLW